MPPFFRAVFGIVALFLVTSDALAKDQCTRHIYNASLRTWKIENPSNKFGYPNIYFSNAFREIRSGEAIELVYRFDQSGHLLGQVEGVLRFIDYTGQYVDFRYTSGLDVNTCPHVRDDGNFGVIQGNVYPNDFGKSYQKWINANPFGYIGPPTFTYNNATGDFSITGDRFIADCNNKVHQLSTAPTLSVIKPQMKCPVTK